MTNPPKANIENVSDTALWVAVHRAEETKRPDALYKDPLAAKLAGERGFAIAKKMSSPQYVAWSLAIRTVIIDDYILKMLNEGVDTVLNLGAGLDTRPYRLELPSTLRWIEVDFPHMIQHKNNVLRDEKPKCQLERVELDLTKRELRQQLFSQIAAKSRKILVITEGVTLYLSNQDVAALADDLKAHSSFQFWISDYFKPQIIRFMQKRRKKELQNAPIQFSPPDWFEFFKQHGWKTREIRYLAEVSRKLGRPVPMPWWTIIFRILTLGKMDRRLVAYVILVPN